MKQTLHQQGANNGHRGYTGCQASHLHTVAWEYLMAKRETAAKGTPEPAIHC